MLKTCTYCGRIHPKGYECKEKPRRNYDRDKKKGKPSDAERFRNTSRWKKLTIAIKERDLYMCQACFCGLGSKLNRRDTGRLSVHHIVPIEKNYELRAEEENLITLCGKHHEEAEMGVIRTEDLKSMAKQNGEEDRVFNIPPYVEL